MFRERSNPDISLRCSFCHKSQEVVGKLISSPGDYPRAFICDECIAVCNSILGDDRSESVPKAAQEDAQEETGEAKRKELQAVVDSIPDGDIEAVLRLLRALEDRWPLLS
jgi:ATP-dependent protease Clp ATPase subunit